MYGLVMLLVLLSNELDNSGTYSDIDNPQNIVNFFLSISKKLIKFYPEIWVILFTDVLSDKVRLDVIKHTTEMIENCSQCEMQKIKAKKHNSNGRNNNSDTPRTG